MDEIRTTTEIDTEVKVEIKLETESLIMMQRKTGQGIIDKGLKKEVLKVKESKRNDIVNGNPQEEKQEKSEKTREEIKAEREAKKLAKQLAKKSKASVGESAINSETATTVTNTSNAKLTNSINTDFTADETNEKVSWLFEFCFTIMLSFMLLPYIYINYLNRKRYHLQRLNVALFRKHKEPQKLQLKYRQRKKKINRKRKNLLKRV